MSVESNPEILVVERQGSHHVTLTLNRPEVRHAFDPALMMAITQTINSLPTTVRTLLIRADGPAFCAGADLAWMKASRTLAPADAKRDAALLDGLFAAMALAPQIIVCAVQGAAFGGGAGLVAAADIAVASHAASFAFSEVRLGLVAAVISPYVVSKVGLGFAREWLLTGRRIDAQEAWTKGLVAQLTAPQMLLTETQQVLERLWQAGPHALASTKALLRDTAKKPWSQQRELALESIAKVRLGDEAQEGMAAFFEKRSPLWRVS